jgi:hypothetical protein
MRKLLYAGVAVLLLPDAVVSSPTARAMDVLGMYRQGRRFLPPDGEIVSRRCASCARPSIKS